jgi:hypothetical protein
MMDRKTTATGGMALRMILGCLMLFLIIFGGVWGMRWRRDWMSKVEWSILQNQEYSTRGSTNTENILLSSESGYHVVGIVRRGPPEVLSPQPQVDRVWVLLDAKYPPLKKILSDEQAEFQVTPAELRAILAYAKTNAAISQELTKHVH